MLPPPLKNLIDQLSKLPEIGPRAATRLAFFLLSQPQSYIKDLSKAIEELKLKTKICKNCFNLATDTLCSICADSKRNKNIICVVEDILDILPIERTRRYEGLYHVLGGLLLPIEGITPEKLRIKELAERVRKLNSDSVEIILALNPTVEGDTTALYLERSLRPFKIKITRLGRGLSSGSDLEYADETTIVNALMGRK